MIGASSRMAGDVESEKAFREGPIDGGKRDGGEGTELATACTKALGQRHRTLGPALIP